LSFISKVPIFSNNVDDDATRLNSKNEILIQIKFSDSVVLLSNEPRSLQF